MTTTYDLEIQLSRLDFDSYHLELQFHAPGGKMPLLPLRSRLQLDFERLQVLFPDPDSYGADLTQALFGDPDRRDYFIQARLQARAAGLPLRLLLKIDPSNVKLAGLRWETLRDPQDGRWLLNQMDTRLIRLIHSPTWNRLPLKAPTGRTLTAISCPKDLAGHAPWTVGQIAGTVNAQQEIDLASRALEAFQNRLLVGPPFGDAPVTPDRLQDALCDGVDVLYLVCPAAMRVRPEGMSLNIFLEEEDGSPLAVTTPRMLEILRGCNIPPLVMLAAPQATGMDGKWRQSDPLGSLRKLVPGVLEMGAEGVLAFNGAAGSEMLAGFLPQFFQVLYSSGYLDRAAAAGRSQVQHLPDAWTPVMYLREPSAQAWRLPGDAPAEVIETTVETQHGNVWLVSASPERFDWEQAFMRKLVLWDRSFGARAQGSIALARPGDIVLVYSADPVHRLIGVGRVGSAPKTVRDWEGERLALELMLSGRLDHELKRDELAAVAPDLEYLSRPLVSFTQVTPQQWAALRPLIEEHNPRVFS